MTTLAPATVKIEVAAAPPTMVQEPGGFIFDELEWDAHKRAIKGWHRQVDETGTFGLRWEEALKAVICEYRPDGRDVVSIGDIGEGWKVDARRPNNVMFDSGEAGFQWDTRDTTDSRTGRVSHRTSMVGRWGWSAPEWNIGGFLAWSQASADPALEWYLESLSWIPENRPFLVILRRDATQRKVDAEGHLTAGGAFEYVTRIGFGRGYCLELGEWQKASLQSRIAGEWQRIAEWDWPAENLYKEQNEKGCAWIMVFPIDGKILFKTDLGAQSAVYEETQPVTVPAGPIIFQGNGGQAHFGLHEIAFDDRPDNWMVWKRPISLPYRPTAPPAPVVVGWCPPGATVEVDRQDGQGGPSFGDEPDPGPFYLGCRLAPTADRRMTPAVRLVGLNYPPVVTAPEITYTDVSDDFNSLNGTREFDLDQRREIGNCRVTLDNSRLAYRDVRGALLMRVSIGRGTQRPRYLGIARLDDSGAQDVANTAATFELLDRLSTLDEMECGYRRPLDGMTVADAIREILSWAYFHSSEIGDIYESGARLPTSAYSPEFAGGNPAAGALDRSAAAVMFSPTARIGDALRYVMQFDYMTGLFWSVVDARVGYKQYHTTPAVARTFEETETGEVMEGTVRRSISRRPRLAEVVTRILVEGLDRKTKETIGATAWARDLVQDAAAIGFRATEKAERDVDHGLGEQRLVNLRCRYLYETKSRLREERAWECVGQNDLFPPARITVNELRSGEAGTYYLLGVTDEATREGGYNGQLETAAWAG